jgi:hypothetical protein
MSLIQEDSSQVKKRTMAAILLDSAFLMDLKRVAAAEHYSSMSEMVREVMKRHIEDVKSKMGK